MKEPFDVTPWVIRLSGCLIGWGVYRLWGGPGWAIVVGLILLIWAIASNIERGAQ
jgi:hypothetical protein